MDNLPLIKPNQLNALTAHESLVLRYVAEGFTLPQIRQKIGVRVASTHLLKIRKKLGIPRSTLALNAAYWRSRYAILEMENKILKHQLFAENAD